MAIYARVSTADQATENQLDELRRVAAARGWLEPAEYIDDGVSGAKESRPALDRLVADCRRRRVDAVLVWRLDRLGRSLRHLVTLLDEWQQLGVAFVSLNEGIDATTAAGRLQMHILAAMAEFERARLMERMDAWRQRARARGDHIGRPRVVRPVDLDRVAGLSVRQAAQLLGTSKSAVARARDRQLSRNCAESTPQDASKTPR